MDTTPELNAQDKGKTCAVEVLDIEDEEQRQERIYTMFTKLNMDSKFTPAPAAPLSFDFGDRTTFAVDLPVDLLVRVQAFLPELATSNVDLARRARTDPTSVDIEHRAGCMPSHQCVPLARA